MQNVKTQLKLTYNENVFFSMCVLFLILTRDKNTIESAKRKKKKKSQGTCIPTC